MIKVIGLLFFNIIDEERLQGYDQLEQAAVDVFPTDDCGRR